jgi:hypothetical protein
MRIMVMSSLTHLTAAEVEAELRIRAEIEVDIAEEIEAQFSTQIDDQIIARIIEAQSDRPRIPVDRNYVKRRSRRRRTESWSEIESVRSDQERFFETHHGC